MKKSKANYWQNKVNYSPRKSFQQYCSDHQKDTANKIDSASPPCTPPCGECGACDD